MVGVKSLKQAPTLDQDPMLRYPCRACATVLPSFKTYTRHVRQHGIYIRPPLFKCSECDFISTHQSTMITHTRRHTGEKPFPCPHCDYRSTTSSNVFRHMRLHSKSSPSEDFTSSESPCYTCPECSHLSTDRMSLQEHLLQHEGQGPFVCGECTHVALTLTHLIQHLHTH